MQALSEGTYATIDRVRQISRLQIGDVKFLVFDWGLINEQSIEAVFERNGKLMVQVRGMADPHPFDAEPEPEPAPATESETSSEPTHRLRPLKWDAPK